MYYSKETLLLGADIHAFVEVDHDATFPPLSPEDDRAFNEGKFFVPNHYDLFDALGDGRSYNIPAEKVTR